MWRETTKHERNRRIFLEELDAFLPKRILDFHVHLFNAETIPKGEKYDCAGHPVSQYGLEELARDLAELYGVETRVLNQSVRRNVDRFPEDFMFQLSRNDVSRYTLRHCVL